MKLPLRIDCSQGQEKILHNGREILIPELAGWVYTSSKENDDTLTDEQLEFVLSYENIGMILRYSIEQEVISAADIKFFESYLRITGNPMKLLEIYESDDQVYPVVVCWCIWELVEKQIADLANRSR